MTDEIAPSSLLRKTEYCKTLSKLTALASKKPIPLQQIIKLYRQGILKGSLNYYRAILKTRSIVYESIRRNMFAIINSQDQDGLKIEMYEEIYTANLVTDREILEIFKEFSREHPNEMFTALENPKSFLIKLCRLIKTDLAESVCVIARTMLESNISCLLEYINSRNHSNTLKYLIKDIEGMAYLKNNILNHLVCDLSTVKALESLFSRIISLHISLSKIDFTLVLLAPVMEHIKEGIKPYLDSFGMEISAEVLFRIISQRASELVQSVNETGTKKERTKMQVPGDMLDFLLSLLPHENMMQALALSTSRDFILARTNRKELVAALESKMGLYRTSNIGIIRKDFEYFSNVEISKSKVYLDVTENSACIPSDIFAGDRKPVVNHFVFSEHYWPESSTQAWDDLFTGSPDCNIQKNRNTYSPSCNQISLEYSKKHTYLDITVEVKNVPMEISVPISYVEYLYNTNCVTEKEGLVIKAFWDHIKDKTDSEM